MNRRRWVMKIIYDSREITLVELEKITGMNRGHIHHCLHEEYIRGRLKRTKRDLDKQFVWTITPIGIKYLEHFGLA